jgi:hypothetical protein
VWRGARATGSSPALLKSDLLDGPQDGGVPVDDVGGPAVNLVDQATVVILAMTQASLRPADQPSVHIHLVDFARIAVAAVNILGVLCDVSYGELSSLK